MFGGVSARIFLMIQTFGTQIEQKLFSGPHSGKVYAYFSNTESENWLLNRSRHFSASLWSDP